MSCSKFNLILTEASVSNCVLEKVEINHLANTTHVLITHESELSYSPFPEYYHFFIHEIILLRRAYSGSVWETLTFVTRGESNPWPQSLGPKLWKNKKTSTEQIRGSCWSHTILNFHSVPFLSTLMFPWKTTPDAKGKEHILNPKLCTLTLYAKVLTFYEIRSGFNRTSSIPITYS